MRKPKAKAAPGELQRWKNCWMPQGTQKALLSCPMDEILFSGDHGSGKTDGMIAHWVQQALIHGKASKGIVVRYAQHQLEEFLYRTYELLPKIGATYDTSMWEWTLPNGASLKMRGISTVEDTYEFAGHQYSWMCFENVTDWHDTWPMFRMHGCLRSAAGVRCQVLMTARPHQMSGTWVEERYPTKWTLLHDPDSGMSRVHIPASPLD